MTSAVRTFGAYEARGAVLVGQFSPWWRYDLAVRAARSGQMLLPGQVDEAVCALADYLFSELQAKTDGERLRLRQAAPALHDALAVWRDRQRTVAVPIEARILARQRAAEIASATGVAADAVKLYRHFFYCFAHNMNDAAYVLHWGVGHELRRRGDRAAADRAALAKFVGYFWGVGGLETIGVAAPRSRAWPAARTAGEIIGQCGWESELSALLRELFGADDRSSAMPGQRLDWAKRLSDILAESPLSSAPDPLFRRLEEAAGGFTL